ncbi:hypothetical protein BV22DRAFT_1038843 [Leucogyrophana mollusca]|uniref:Uncharacterized protein n=1 Tax=Leucogyrophana mollusca TaxID=85980 RepID=A0ACB8B7V6_9AGAM|nr:hypothetical protein BV22DRAFT_1038843 [Leucogyrophana mollusca]
MSTAISTSSVMTSTAVLGKRKAALVLHLSSASECELPAKKARHRCTYPGCTKSYTKPCRLAEHTRSHTGERPFICTVCQKSYLRESHLQAHSQSHKPESERPLVCTTCEKRFWTLQHLHIHEAIHSGAKTYACTKASCDKVFAKHHQLRDHLCTVHAPPGTKPYQCTHDACAKSFATNQKLRAHLKTHDDKRYTCSHTACLPSTSSSQPTNFYATWSALQSHIRTAHPPTCTTCDRTFASHANLRAHAKLHEQKEVEHLLGDHEEDEGDEGERKRKKRRGGEVGRDWKCDFSECGKDFKSKKALTTHHKITHLGRRDHICPHAHCTSAFGYKHLLQRHLAKIHSSPTHNSSISNPAPPSAQMARDDSTSETDPEPETDADVDKPLDDDQDDPTAFKFDIDLITGKFYAQSHSAKPNSKHIHCPWPDVAGLLPDATGAFPQSHTEMPMGSSSQNSRLSSQIAVADPGSHAHASTRPCAHVLTRAYDLRRHLRAEHGLDVDKDVVDSWVRRRGRGCAQCS